MSLSFKFVVCLVFSLELALSPSGSEKLVLLYLLPIWTGKQTGKSFRTCLY